MYELFISDDKNLYTPVTTGSVQLDWERQGAPGKLTFSYLADAGLPVREGSPVGLKVDGKDVFFGFLFERRHGKDRIVSATAYDQLRYLKNKDTYEYKNKTATEVIQMVAGDFQLKTGELEDTKLKIKERRESNKTLFDVIINALYITLQKAGEMYVLYDQYGFLTLKNIQNMKLDLLICHRTAEDYDYSVSIDGDTCNQIKLYQEDKEAGKRRIYLAKDTENINQWGVLQYYEQVEEGENGQAKADALLALYNQKTRKLSVKNALGDIRVRPGCLLPVQLDLGEEQINHYMLVEKASHRFENGFHTMDLTLRGGGFLA